jgi:hypothetical protein
MAPFSPQVRVSPQLEPAGQPFHRRAHHAARPPRRKPSPANRCPTFGGYGIDYITDMPSPDETNDLLREIRDLLAGQEARYEIHRAETKKIYEAANRMAIRRQLVSVVIMGVVLGIWFAIVQSR